MIRPRRTFANNPNYSLKLFRSWLRTKPSYDIDDTTQRKDKGEDGKEAHLRLFKSRGQHLLTNPRILDSIIRTSDIKPDDTVLEIGPGTGNLTIRLLEAAMKVVAVEIDSRMVEILRTRAAEHGLEDRLNVVYGDALKVDLPEYDIVVANIPYNISSPLLARLVFGANARPYRSATLLLQKEFARRLMAKPGDSEYNRLAVNVKLAAEVEFVMDVSKRDFMPCPKVDSSVVKIYPKMEIPDVNLEEWWAFTRTCFSKKNKTLGATFRQKKKLVELMKLSNDRGVCEGNRGNDGQEFGNEESMSKEDSSSESKEDSSSVCVSPGASSDSFKEKVMSVLESGGFSDKRPSKLSNDDLLQLLAGFNQEGIHFHDGRTRSNNVYHDAFAD